MRFQKKTVVVTGAGSGFGKAIAEQFAGEGASVVVSDVDSESGEAVAQAIVDGGGAARFVAADVSRAQDVEALIQATKQHYGSLDVLVNNAGFSHLAQAMWELSEEEYDKVFAVNTKGTFLAASTRSRS